MEQAHGHNEHAEVAVRGHPEAATRKEGSAMPNEVVMTGYGPPEVLKWAAVPLAEPGEGQIRIKVKAAGISPTDLALRAGYLKAIPLPPNAVLGFEAAGTVDAVGPGVTGTSAGDGVTALLFSLGGYAEYTVASIWARKPDPVSWLHSPPPPPPPPPPPALPPRAHAGPAPRCRGRADRFAGRRPAPPGRAPIHAHAAGRRGPPPAGKRRRARAHHPHPQLARAAQRRPASRS